MKKIICALLVLTISFICVGCRKGREYRYYSLSKYEREWGEKLLDCLSNNDTDGIKKLFCRVVSESTGFDDEAQEAVEFFDGEVVSYGDIGGFGQQSTDFGKTNYAIIKPTISDIKTNTGKNYEIDFYAYIIDADHPERDGISSFTIKGDNGIFTLGDYYMVHPEEKGPYNTDPSEPDTDCDGLNDSDEAALGTDPKLADTDGDGIRDYDEKFDQTLTYTVQSKNWAVEQVIVSMKGTGYIQTNTAVEDIMDKDVICSEVVGLVGDPFLIDSGSDIDTATIMFKIDKSQLGGTEFKDLLFLWYDEENLEFIELRTNFDEAKSLVSVQTDHFGKYMVVDKNEWYAAWS